MFLTKISLQFRDVKIGKLKKLSHTLQFYQ